ncbi:MAG TPA: GH116 family glycosyl-hydrolase, partial [Acidobacteriota bacterium]|nr:GH116 family glycosyl-hydrolase [Acidobacteriota bacterium]
VRQGAAANDKQILKAALDALNYAPTNLLGFPQAAFDRPIGTTLESFGRTIAPGDIEARADGSACPVGGIGAGSFERLMNGNFSTWFLKPGWMVEDTVWADQFHVFMRSAGRTVVRTLSTSAPPAGAGLTAWAWNYPVGKGDYFALYPKSGFSYEESPELPAKLAVVQFSPVLAGNYKETSYPVALYRWVAVNPTKQPVEVSLLLTWENMVGWEAVPARPAAGAPPQASFVWDRASRGNVNEFVESGRHKGILFRREGLNVKTGKALSGTMAIAVVENPGRTRVHFQAAFDPRGDGADVWTKFAADGTLDGTRTSAPAAAGSETGAALAVSFTLKPGEKLEVPFAVAWDFPYYEFESGAKMKRKYTAFFGAEGTSAFRLAAEALGRAAEWEQAVDAWQKPVLADPKLPDWLKQALLNELYVLAETSIWDAVTDLHTYLESADYLMFGTTDVDSYCWHILKLWPELEKRNMEFIARTIPLEDSTFRAFQYASTFPQEVPPDKLDYYWNTIKVPGMVPHDLGSPRKRPWTILNAFDWQNANVWKDLNPKFPLRAYRDFLADGGLDMGFLLKMFEASVLAMDTLEEKFGDKASHIPLNEGIPDQTYDTWRMKGESAYVGLVWLAGLKATIRMGETLAFRGLARVSEIDIASVTEKYRSWFAAGRASLAKLWDEKAGYFHIDAATDDIMTDQLFGVWYARMLGLEADDDTALVPPASVGRALRTIYEKNVLGYGKGVLGAVNGRKADGGQLRSQQGDEVWVGTSYAFAAALVLEGLVEEALHTAYGLYHVVYSPYGQGYFFKTPEAYLDPNEALWNDAAKTYGERTFRAMKYMRPGAVWALYEALLKNRP